MNVRILAFALTATAVLGLTGCAAPGVGSADYVRSETRGEMSVRFGVVESVRGVRIDTAYTGVGGTTGAILGGIAGSTVGGGNGQIAGAVAGALLGGIIGSNVEKDANNRPGIEVTVLLDGGTYIAVVQEADETFRIGDRVRVLSGRGSTRVSH